VVRLARMSLAVVLLAAGAAMLVLPGPGWLVIAAGLAVLARDVAWAERWLRVSGAVYSSHGTNRTTPDW
jgi:hypothetical protein